MEDGCSKRFDIETVDFRPQIYTNSPDATSLRYMAPIAIDTQSRQPSYSSSTSGSHDQTPLTSASGGYLQRQDYLTTDHHRDPIWTN